MEAMQDIAFSAGLAQIKLLAKVSLNCTERRMASIMSETTHEEQQALLQLPGACGSSRQERISSSLSR